MPQVVQATCPGCKKTLRVPADWLKKAMRCKHCGMALQARSKGTPARVPRSAPAKPANPAPGEKLAVAAADSDSSDEGNLVFGTPADGALARGRRKRRSQGGWKRLLVAAVALAVFAGAGYFLWQRLDSLGWLDKVSAWAANEPGERGATSGPRGKARSAAAPFPRRVLAIGVCNYLYANPVGYGDDKVNFHTVTERVANRLKIPPDQVVVLTDGALEASKAEVVSPRGKARASDPKVAAKGLEVAPRPPLKAVIEQTVTEFLDGSRSQDRIVLLFAGHVAEIGDETFLVPLEGELTSKETLIGLSWLFERLHKCKACQKLVLFDVCRYDSGRGKERPGSEPLGAKAEATLKKPPEGVQVWLACSAEQNSYELDGRGVFLGKLFDALDSKKRTEGIQAPEDPLPVAALAKLVQSATEEEVTLALGSKQTPLLTGQEAGAGAPYDPSEPAPPTVAVRVPSPPGGAAGAADVTRILEEIDIPPMRQDQVSTAAFRLETLLPFSAQAIQNYRPDYNSYAQLLEEVKAKDGEGYKHPVRKAVLDSVRVLREAKLTLQETFSGGGNEKVKAIILQEQRKPARALLELQELHEKLQKVDEARERETKRWQAHYDFVLAQVLARLAYVHEYDLMLGKIRKDELPPLDKTQTGYRLSSRERLQAGKEVRDLAAESKKLLNRLVKEHPGTPWEVLAKRERLAALGLEWQPTR